MNRIDVRNLGRVSYESARDLQLALLAERAAEKIPDTLLCLEHPPVFTLGKKSPEVKAGMSLSDVGGVPVFFVERGGEATFHGPGQVVMYPIFRLNAQRGPKSFLRSLEECMVSLLAEYGIHATFIEGKTGVWIEGKEKKIASLGIAVRQGISYHGLALNVSTDLTYFRMIEPCGFSPDVMTNMREWTDKDLSGVSDRLAEKICERFA